MYGIIYQQLFLIQSPLRCCLERKKIQVIRITRIYSSEGVATRNPDEDYVVTFLDIELADGIGMDKFETAVAACAAESSLVLGQRYMMVRKWCKDGREMKAIAFDLDPQTKTFKIAYRKELFETGNLSGLLAGVVGKYDGMKMLKAFRCLDIRFPREWVLSMPGPAFGIDGR
jgi:ribulose 1,5-bisphosphate carboxylase large subunit-like protein